MALPYHIFVPGGRQQRPCIARSLAVGPEILFIMVDPCSATDPIAAQKNAELNQEEAIMQQNDRKKIRVLFVCVHNSGRSQMAETFLNAYGGGRFVVESAGLEPGSMNPRVVEAMGEIGFDLSKNTADSVFDFYKQGRLYDYVITVCHDSEGKCPIFPGIQKRLNWPFEDPSKAEGDRETMLKKVRKIRDEIEDRVKSWVSGI